MNAAELRQRAVGFVRSLAGARAGEYRICPGGESTLEASCFAALALHTAGALAKLEPRERSAWAEHLQSFQDPGSGLFRGPELEGALESAQHDREHLELHLTCHALPALALLGARPAHPMRAAQRLLDPGELRAWLERRDWRRAWREGNELLFTAQLLLHLLEVEGRREAAPALDLWFDWLGAQQDPRTGLWGTDRGADRHGALFGAYHPLLAYHYCGRPVPRARRILDTTLTLQHPDGGFAPQGGGGACEDLDAIDVLVNLHRRTGHRPRAVRSALRGALASVLRRRQPDGGFVYRRGERFVHMGMRRSAAPADVSHLFATWFALHGVALACELLPEHPLAAPGWGFNPTCSMGWHDPHPSAAPRPDPLRDRGPEAWQQVALSSRHGARRAWLRARQLAGRARRWIGR